MHKQSWQPSWRSSWLSSTGGSLLSQLLANPRVTALWEPTDIALGPMPDLTGNGYDADQSLGTQMPAFVGGSKPYQLFDGSDDYLSFSEINDDKMLIAVALQYSVTSATSMVAGHSTANSRIGTFSDQWFGRVNATSASLTGGTVDLSGNVLLAVSDGTTQRLRLNGQELSSSAAAASDAFFDLLGCTGSGQFFSGRFYGGLIMTGDITSSDIALVEDYLTSKLP